MKLINRIALATALSLVTASITNGQSIINGSFENPYVPGSPTGSQSFNNSSPMPNWSLPAGAPAADIFILSSALTGHGDAYAGTQYASNVAAYAFGQAADSVISQTVSGFSVGTAYELHYAIADAYGADGLASFMDVTITDGKSKIGFLSDSSATKIGFLDETIVGGSSATVWEQRTIAFTPTTTDVTFTFDFSVPSSSQLYSAALDGVSVSAVTVPEPSSALLAVVGSLAILRRRR